MLPVACVAVGALMVGRSDLPRFGPFRTGLVVVAVGLALVLGGAHGGYLGRGLEDVLGKPIGSTGTQILGVFLLLAGVLLVTGASAGAFVRRSGQRRAERGAAPGVAPARDARARAGRRGASRRARSRHRSTASRSSRTSLLRRRCSCSTGTSRSPSRNPPT